MHRGTVVPQAAAIALAASFLSLGARAQTPTDQSSQQQQLKTQQQEIEELKREVQELKDAQRSGQPAPTPPAPAATTPPRSGSGFQFPAPVTDVAPTVSEVPQVTRPSVTGINREPPPGLASTLSVRYRGVSVGLYGFVDVSFDHADNGAQTVNQVSSNESFLGIAGGVDLASPLYRAIFQVETMVETSATPGVGSSLGSRNSFVGFASPYGSLMWGKYDTPYKRATALMNPFKASVGDYNSVMGNSAGEGRARVRRSHAACRVLRLTRCLRIHVQCPVLAGTEIQ